MSEQRSVDEATPVMTERGRLMRLLEAASALARYWPEVLDVVDAEEVLRRQSRELELDSVLRTPGQVAELRSRRAPPK